MSPRSVEEHPCFEMTAPGRRKAKRLVIVPFLLILNLLSLNVNISEDIDIDAIWRVLDQPEH